MMVSKCRLKEVETKLGTVRGSGIFKLLGVTIGSHEGCERNVIQKLNEKYKA